MMLQRPDPKPGCQTVCHVTMLSRGASVPDELNLPARFRGQKKCENLNRVDTHSGLLVGVQVCSSTLTSTLSGLESMRQEEEENELFIPQLGEYQTIILEKIKILVLVLVVLCTPHSPASLRKGNQKISHGSQRCCGLSPPV